ncbi:MAG: GNAT family N-acetyltransferase, partial [Eubacterium sp.]
MNIIYITGAPRCGKTTLAGSLCKNNASLLSLDSISKALRFTFNDFKLYTGKICIQPDINKDTFLSFIKHYCDNFRCDFPDYTLLVEGCHFMPKEFLKAFPEAKVICLGIESEEKAIASINCSEWMVKLDNNIKNQYAQMICDYSKELKNNQLNNCLYFERDYIDFSKIKEFIGDENMKKQKEPILETERLILRPITLDDAEACFSWNSDERVTKFMSYPTVTDISQTIEWIKSTLVDEKEWNWAFVLKEENKVIGSGGIGPSDKIQGYWGMGYNLHYDYWH